MQRLRDERGATSVMVALLMVPLIAFAAIAIDVAAIYAERQQLQAGADAAALAIAQDCARGDCRVPPATAQQMTTANLNNGEATATVTDPALSPASGEVTVQSSGSVEHWFARVLGFEQSTVTAESTAAWGYPTGGTSMLPLALHRCEFFAQASQQGAGTPSGEPAMLTILQSKDLEDLPPDWPCESSGDNPAPGGFGWLDTDPGTCRATTEAGARHASDPGNSIPSSCDDVDLSALRDATFLLPLYDTYGGQGNNAWYDIVGYAAFTLKGYEISGPPGHSWGAGCPESVNTCISGYFEEYVDISDDFGYTPGPPRFGAAVVSLIR